MLTISDGTRSMRNRLPRLAPEPAINPLRGHISSTSPRLRPWGTRSPLALPAIPPPTFECAPGIPGHERAIGRLFDSKLWLSPCGPTFHKDRRGQVEKADLRDIDPQADR